MSLVSPHDLYLEIDSTQKTFGGEARLLMQADKLADAFLGAERRCVLTDRPEWAQAFLADEDTLLAPGQSAQALAPLSVERLLAIGDPFTLEDERRDREKLVMLMRKVGLRTIGDFLALPASAVHKRFGKLGEILREWTAGHRSLCLPLFAPVDTIQEIVDADDLHSLDSLLFRLRQILVRIEARLHGRGRAAKRILLTFNFESHDPIQKPLELMEGTQDATAILRVLREFLNGFHWESPLVRLELAVTDTVAHSAGQLSLFDDSENRFHDLAQYVSRLRARLGDDNVGFASFKGSHLPERSYQLTWPPPAALPERNDFPQRPLFLFTPPKPFQPSPRWDLTLSENLFVEWWEPGGCRQYFVARNGKQCLWVYRDSLKGNWFTHGSFD